LKERRKGKRFLSEIKRVVKNIFLILAKADFGSLCYSLSQTKALGSMVEQILSRKINICFPLQGYTIGFFICNRF